MNKKASSELRYDLLSKNWVVIATGRARKPKSFKEKKKKEKVSKSGCPFCKIETQEHPTVIFSNGEKVDSLDNKWTTVSIPNKYPAFTPGNSLNKRKEGNFYQTIDAVGYHEVVVTRDHEKSIACFSLNKVEELIDVFQERFLDLKKKPFVKYISIFHNHGEKAGASIAHPHSQIITTPLIDTDLEKALVNSGKYYKAHHQCFYCLMNKWEQKLKRRIVFENKSFLAICPFASKSAFQVIISPKKHSAYFEKISKEEKKDLAQSVKVVLSKLYKGLNDPPYNFYIHTAPTDNKDYDYYHWHWTIMPKTSIWAGFELGAGMEISTIEPEKAAEYLRKQ